MQRASWAASLLAAFSIVLAGAMLVGIPDETRSFANLAFATMLVPYAVVGALVASRQPGNAIGWLFVGSSTIVLFGSVMAVLSAPFVTDHEWGTIAIAVGLAAIPMANVGFGLLVTFLLLLFPDGLLPSRGWRPIAWLIGVIIGVLAVSQLFAEQETLSGYPNPIATWPPAEGLRTIHSLANGVLLPAAVIASLAALAFRYRRSRGIERLQLRWFLFVAALMVATLFATALVPAFQPAGDIVGPLMFAALPITVAVAILRYRLYDIDILIRRTLVYGALSATLAAVYWGSVIVLQATLSRFAGADTLAVAASTLAVAALFQPARGRIKAAVDRRFYRSRYDAKQTAERFGASLRHEVDIARLTGSFAAAVSDSIQPASVSVWLRRGTGRG